MGKGWSEAYLRCYLATRDGFRSLLDATGIENQQHPAQYVLLRNLLETARCTGTSFRPRATAATGLTAQVAQHALRGLK